MSKPHPLLALSLLLVAGSVQSGIAQKLASPTKVWSVGPLTPTQSVGSVAFGPGGAVFSSPHPYSQTRSIFSALRSIVFAGDRIVLASETSMSPEAYELLSLDQVTGEVKSKREFKDRIMAIFATDDGHIILSATNVLRLTRDLKDENSFDYQAAGHKYGRIQNISPDGTTLGNATSPGFELVDSHNFKITPITKNGAVDTSVNSTGFLTDNVHWIGQYPKDMDFVTYTDTTGDHLLYHGNCGGRPQFLTNTIFLEPGCKNPLLLDMQGKLVRTLEAKQPFAFANASQNGKLIALQVEHSAKRERFVIYSIDTGKAIAEVQPDIPGEEQSWTAFSPDGTLFVVGSPMKLTLYRLP